MTNTVYSKVPWTGRFWKNFEPYRLSHGKDFFLWKKLFFLLRLLIASLCFCSQYALTLPLFQRLEYACIFRFWMSGGPLLLCTLALYHSVCLFFCTETVCRSGASHHCPFFKGCLVTILHPSACSPSPNVCPWVFTVVET